MTEKDREDLDHFCTLVIATYHFEYHKALERLKDAYAPFDPDADTKLLVARASAADRARGRGLQGTDLAHGASQLPAQGRGRHRGGPQRASEGGINMDVDLGVFERYEIFARGETKEVRRSRKWWKLWKLKEKTEDVWKRLVLVFKLRPHKRLSKNLDFKKIYVRVYKDIPKLDLETLVPGAAPQMTWWDKGNIGVPVASGVGALMVKVLLFVLFLYGLYKLDTKGLPETFIDAPPAQKAHLLHDRRVSARRDDARQLRLQVVRQLPEPEEQVREEPQPARCSIRRWTATRASCSGCSTRRRSRSAARPSSATTSVARAQAGRLDGRRP
jgi:hypothetical protein